MKEGIIVNGLTLIKNPDDSYRIKNENDYSCSILIDDYYNDGSGSIKTIEIESKSFKLLSGSDNVKYEIIATTNKSEHGLILSKYTSCFRHDNGINSYCFYMINNDEIDHNVVLEIEKNVDHIDWVKKVDEVDTNSVIIKKNSIRLFSNSRNFNFTTFIKSIKIIDQI
jgi:hypothetical protein